ncbi:MAG: cellobiose phosphorylase [Lachnospiraceae bacterium]|nr:cellobiose phosphorylase [Lachnospiraceae bacterium]
MSHIKFKDKNGTFTIKNPENISGLYFPLAGESGLKSSMTPNLGGDSKTDQNHFLYEPVSVENLHNNKNTRNFWVCMEGKGNWSVTGSSAEHELNKFTSEQDENELEAGFMWQKLTRSSKKYGIQADITSYVTLDGLMEVMLVELTNVSKERLEFTPFAAIPIYGRSADNIRDHRHVTSLLHRIQVVKEGIEVKPVLSFDERGHQKNNTTYFVYGFTEGGSEPIAFYPTVEEFIGEGGSFLNPKAIRINDSGRVVGEQIAGKEAMGGIRFEKVTLDVNHTVSYIVLAGVVGPDQSSKSRIASFKTKDMVEAELEMIKSYWTEKVNVSFYTGDEKTDLYMKWISFQPILRRIYGCSFLPYHDYGKGGRGWRDLWQDCLALLIMDPSVVRQMIVDNYCGVRIDGTNATIIGSKQGEFIADRNNITRVWMDHAFWPFLTTKLYMDQTGDMDILLSKIPYFKDRQAGRGTNHDEKWSPQKGSYLRTASGETYFGSVLEHILVQNLCAFYDVGEHNQMKLHGADWNDALDMAEERGESVAFTCAYAGNLKELAMCLKELQKMNGYNKIELAEEMAVLLAVENKVYESIERKQAILDQYVESCKYSVSGRKVVMNLEELCNNLYEKADWIMEHVRTNEWIEADNGVGWFNGYYDNHGNIVESYKEDHIRMMLTGQVFSIMSGTAKKKQIEAICKSADQYLYDLTAGGYRLNTDFGEEKFDLGRMFGFAYGEKENGAVFSHMTVMYGYALYKQGYAKEGFKVLNSLMDTAKNFMVSKIYPGLPEYFDQNGKGLYPYLTGAASWFMLTMITEVFGVKGNLGDLLIAPALMPEQFDQDGKAQLSLVFSGKELEISFYNTEKIMCGEKQFLEVKCDYAQLKFEPIYGVRLARKEILNLPVNKKTVIEIRVS